MLPWKLRKHHILPVNQDISSVYILLAKCQLISCNLFLAIIWQMTYSQTVKTVFYHLQRKKKEEIRFAGTFILEKLRDSTVDQISVILVQGLPTNLKSNSNPKSEHRVLGELCKRI